MSLTLPPMQVGKFLPALQTPLTHSSSFASSSISLPCKKALTSDTFSPRFQGDIHEAAKTGKVEALERLAIDWQNVDKKDGEGKTALAYACENGHEKVVRYLIAKGADLDLLSAGKTPIKHALAKKQHAVAALLHKDYRVNYPSADKYNNPEYLHHKPGR